MHYLKQRHMRLLIFFVTLVTTLLLILFYTVSHCLSVYVYSRNDEGIAKNASDTQPKIVFWTKVFGRPPKLDRHCPIKTPCIYTTDHSESQTADAIIFHGSDIDVKVLPSSSTVRPLQKFVLYSQEAWPSLSGIYQNDHWNTKIKFHWVMSYLSKSHVRAPYGGFLVDPQTGKQRGFKPIANFTKEQVLASKKYRGAIWFVSNCASAERLKVAKALEKHFHLNIGGACGDQLLCPRRQDCKALMSQYYFYLAFENNNCKDYVTEKFHDHLELPIVPIQRELSVGPSKAVIAIDDFANATELVKHLNYLMDNSDEYFKLIEWRNNWTKAKWNTESYLLDMCALCQKLQTENVETKPIDDLEQWYIVNSECKQAVNSAWYE